MIRKARIHDAPKIHALINGFAKNDLMMPRSLNEIYETVRDFWVALDKKGAIVGCAALHIVGWNDLAELKSLAVVRRRQKKGFGSLLIQACLDEAAELKIGSVFALTYSPAFFRRFGFRTISKTRLPHKIWAECCNCPKFPHCGEIAVLKKIRK
jgi:amino-acid N-acetyltransferase